MKTSIDYLSEQSVATNENALAIHDIIDDLYSRLLACGHLKTGGEIMKEIPDNTAVGSLSDKISRAKKTSDEALERMTNLRNELIGSPELTVNIDAQVKAL